MIISIFFLLLYSSAQEPNELKEGLMSFRQIISAKYLWMNVCFVEKKDNKMFGQIDIKTISEANKEQNS